MSFLKPMNLARIAQLTIVWGVIFAVVHGYWAAGGAAGMDGDPADTLGAQIYIAIIAALGLAGAAVAGGLGRGSSRRILVMPARIGGAALLLGVVFGAGQWLVDWSLDGDGVQAVAITLYFLVGGVLFSALGWRGPASRLPQARTVAF